MSDLRTAANQMLEALEGGADSWQLVGPAIDALKEALADPGSDYERGFVDGMLEQARRSVDKAVNAMAEPIIKPEIKDDKPVPPPEAQTEAEKIAYCAGWWAALEAERKELLRIAEKP